jgi:cytochrome c peroxidase
VATLALGLAGCLAAAPVAAGPLEERALARLASPPLGLPPVPLPADGPPTALQVALGRKLFFDPGLSFNGTMSCGLCHLPEQGFTSQELARPVGIEGRSLRRNAPTLLNVAYLEHLFHDGRETSLETQPVGPLLDRREMANPAIGLVIDRLRASPDYAGLFEAAFGQGPSVDRLGQAIAAYERTLLLAASPFDRWRYGGEPDALGAAEKRGFALFTGEAGCSSCHPVGERAALLTDQDFHDTGIGWRNAERRRQLRQDGSVPVRLAPGVTATLPFAAVASVGREEEPDLGRHEVTQATADLYRVRTPSLRNVALTAPYMHDGSLATLEAVVRHYAAGGVPHPGQDERLRPLALDEAEITALVSFLESLTGRGVAEIVEEAQAALTPAASRR